MLAPSSDPQHGPWSHRGTGTGHGPGAGLQGQRWELSPGLLPVGQSWKGLGQGSPGSGQGPGLASAGCRGVPQPPFWAMDLPMPPKGSEVSVMCMMVSLAQKPPLLVRSSTRFTT